MEHAQVEALCPRPGTVGVLSFDAWMLKSAPFLAGIRNYLERVLKTTCEHLAISIGAPIHVDYEAMYASLWRYIYKTSINRYKEYKIIE